MKKLFTLIAMFALVGATFVSCEKDDESASNTITITGTFEVGDKTYTNPTFDLGSPEDHIAWTQATTPMKNGSANMIKVYLKDEIINIGGVYNLYYRLRIYNDQPGAADGDINVEIFTDEEKSSVYFGSDEFLVNVTSIGEVGGYIEGTYEGTLYCMNKSVEGFPVKGKFKVKRVPMPETKK